MFYIRYSYHKNWICPKSCCCSTISSLEMVWYRFNVLDVPNPYHTKWIGPKSLKLLPFHNIFHPYTVIRIETLSKHFLHHVFKHVLNLSTKCHVSKHHGPYSQRDFCAILTNYGFKSAIKSSSNSEHDFKLKSNLNKCLKSLKLV